MKDDGLPSEVATVATTLVSGFFFFILSEVAAGCLVSACFFPRREVEGVLLSIVADVVVVFVLLAAA